jgi:hypothetical protein
MVGVRDVAALPTRRPGGSVFDAGTWLRWLPAIFTLALVFVTGRVKGRRDRQPALGRDRRHGKPSHVSGARGARGSSSSLTGAREAPWRRVPRDLAAATRCGRHGVP